MILSFLLQQGGYEIVVFLCTHVYVCFCLLEVLQIQTNSLRNSVIYLHENFLSVAYDLKFNSAILFMS